MKKLENEKEGPKECSDQLQLFGNSNQEVSTNKRIHDSSFFQNVAPSKIFCPNESITNTPKKQAGYNEQKASINQKLDVESDDF